jgi:hypothetical protein
MQPSGAIQMDRRGRPTHLGPYVGEKYDPANRKWTVNASYRVLSRPTWRRIWTGRLLACTHNGQSTRAALAVTTSASMPTAIAFLSSVRRHC